MTGYKKKGGPKGHHKIRGKAKNMASGVKPQSISKNTMTPSKGRQVDRDLGNLRNGR